MNSPEQPGRVLLSVSWTGRDGKGGGETTLDLTKGTRFDIKDAGSLQILAKVLDPPKPEHVVQREALRKLLADAREGKVPTIPLAWSSDCVVLDEGTRVVHVNEGTIGPKAALHVGGTTSFRALVVGLEVARETALIDCDKGFTIHSLVVARNQLVSDVAARVFCGDWKERPPIDGGILGAGCHFFLQVYNGSDQPASIRGCLHVVDLTEYGL